MNFVKLNAISFLALFLSFSANAASKITDLKETLTPVTASAPKGSRWITIEAELELPINLESYLLTHYIEMWDNNELPESFDKLKQSFEDETVENKGYPVVLPNGDINSSAVKYWIKKHIAMSPVLGFREESRAALSFGINQKKTFVDEVTQTLHLVYQVRFEVSQSESSQNFVVALPKSIHQEHMRVMGAQDIYKTAIEALEDGELPRPRLAWRDRVLGVKHACLGEEAVQGALTLESFLSNYDAQRPQCYLSAEEFAKIEVVRSETPIADVTVYPEYHELFKDKKLSVLIAIQECNDHRYACEEGNMGHRVQIERLLMSLKDFGYNLVARDANTSVFVRNIGDLEVKMTVYYQKRPVHFEKNFWDLYRSAEIVVSNRIPLLSEQFSKVYAPHYQIVVSPSVTDLAWGRILPHLDYSLESFDGVDVNINYDDDGSVLTFIERIAQVSKVYKQKLEKWPVDANWKQLLGTFKNTSAVAHFVRGNNFNPNKGQQKYFDFNQTPVLEDYVALLNKTFNEEEDSYNSTINYRLAYLYLTLHFGDKATTFEALRESLKSLCESQITNKVVKNWYFFKNCTPRSLLVSEKTKIVGVNFARGSFMELFVGKAGIPKFVYLADKTRIGDFVFKPYYQDTAGAVRFYQKTGKVQQGHLAQNTDYMGLPLLGGMGTSMLRFYEDGTLQTAQLRQNVDFTVGKNRITLRGATRGPHQVSFDSTGKLNCAYLAKDQKVDGYEMAGVNSSIPGVNGSKEDRKVCFHNNGRLLSGMLAKEMPINGTSYPAGALLTIDDDGKIMSPIYRMVKENQHFWKTLFPKDSLYMVNTSNGNPKWIRLNGPVTLRNHSLTTGTEVTFNERGTFLAVKAPMTGDRPRIAFRDYAISVPSGATLVFSEYSAEPQELQFEGTVTIGDVTYVATEDSKGNRRTIRFHDSGRVESGVLANDILVNEPHYGAIPLKGGTEVEFDEAGRITRGTLAREFLFTYKILNKDEIPERFAGKAVSQLPSVSLTAGTEFELGYQGKLESAILSEVWVDGDMRVEAGGRINFDDANMVESLSLGEAGGQFGHYLLGKTTVRLYPNGQPQSLLLGEDAIVTGMSIPKGSTVQFFASGLVKQVTAPESAQLSVRIDGRKFTREVMFYETGKVKRGYLHEGIEYSGVKIASFARCLEMRLASPSDEAESCAVTFYEDGRSLVRGVVAEKFEFEGRSILPGQQVEFDEDGKLFLSQQ